jgi:hypothetical protein
MPVSHASGHNLWKLQAIEIAGGGGAIESLKLWIEK